MSFQVFPDLDMGAKVIFLAQRLHRTLPGGGEGLLCCRAAPQQESAASKAPNPSPLLFLWEWDFAWNAALTGGQVGPWLLNIKYDPNQWFLWILFLPAHPAPPQGSQSGIPWDLFPARFLCSPPDQSLHCKSHRNRETGKPLTVNEGRP